MLLWGVLCGAPRPVSARRGRALPSSAMNTLHMSLPTGRDKEVWTENVGVPLLRRSEASEDWAEACTNPADPMNATNTLQSTGPWGLRVLQKQRISHLRTLCSTEHLPGILHKISSSLRSALMRLSADRRHTHRWPSQVLIFRRTTF